jgi:CBS domain-containing protein
MSTPGDAAQLTLNYAKGSAARAPFLFGQRCGSLPDLPGTDAPVPLSSLTPLQISALVEPIVTAMRHTSFYDIMGVSSLVVVLDVNSPLSVCIAAAQETRAASFLVWDPSHGGSGKGRFVAVLTLSTFIRVLVHCHENADQVQHLSNTPLRDLLARSFLKSRPSGSADAAQDRAAGVVHAHPDVSLYDMLGLMIRCNINHVPVCADSLPGGSSSSSSSTAVGADASTGLASAPAGSGSAPTSLVGVAYLPQLLSQVVRIINNPTVNIVPSPSAAGLPYTSLFEVPLSVLPRVGEYQSAREVDGVALWLRPDDTLHTALKLLIDYRVQALPVIDASDGICDSFSRADVIGLEEFGIYNLTQTVQHALARLKHRSVAVCQLSDTVGDVVAHFVGNGVRTVFVVEGERSFVGQLQVVDLLKFLFSASG